MDARFLINDGQHRKAAIQSALQEDLSLGNETIPVVFFADAGLTRSQQIFTDLNKHAVKTSNAIAELYDSRDPLAVITRNVIAAVPFLDTYTDKEADYLGKYSSNLFSLNTFYKANKKILAKSAPNSEAESFLITFWTLTAQNIVQWGELERKEISKIDLREKYIVTQAVVVLALGRVGATFYQAPEYTPAEILPKLQTVNWRRNAAQWKMRAISPNGRMITGEHAAKLIGNYLKNVLGLPLTEDELHQEEKFLSTKR
jgi:DGQHR domain